MAEATQTTIQHNQQPIIFTFGSNPIIIDKSKHESHGCKRKRAANLEHLTQIRNKRHLGDADQIAYEKVHSYVHLITSELTTVTNRPKNGLRLTKLNKKRLHSKSKELKGRPFL